MVSAIPIKAVNPATLRARLQTAADGLAILLIATLPVSTSATGILAGLWAVCLLPTMTAVEWRRILSVPAAYLPVSLVLLGAVGMLWADVSWDERLAGFGSFPKLLAIPLLMTQFARAPLWASRALAGFLLVCAVILLLTAIFYVWPSLYWRDFFTFPAPFKNVPTQSNEFTTCIFVLLFLAAELVRNGRYGRAALVLLLCVGFLAAIVFVATGRTSLVVAVALLPLLCFKLFNRRTAIWVLGSAGAMCVALWFIAPNLHQRTTALIEEARSYQASGALTSSGERLEFWKKSLGAIARAPMFGHGTGSIAEQMRIETQGQTGPYATVTLNPHQQTLAVAVQLGIVGAMVLWAMWLSNLAVFRGPTLAAWVGVVVVVQTIVGSLFNSHLFDFTQGWFYVLGFGIAAGEMMRTRDSTTTEAA